MKNEKTRISESFFQSARGLAAQALQQNSMMSSYFFVAILSNGFKIFFALGPG